MIYYISDLHLGHANCIGLANRPFSDVDEMDRFLIDSWNTRVNSDDHIYVVGDLSFRSKSPVSDYLEKLKGYKHLIVGNHDHTWMKKIEAEKWFESIELLQMVEDKGRKVMLCHYPMMTWPYKNSYLVYGHIHNNKHMDYWPLLKTYERALNACVEINSYQPVTLDELIVSNEQWRNAAQPQLKS